MGSNRVQHRRAEPMPRRLMPGSHTKAPYTIRVWTRHRWAETGNITYVATGHSQTTLDKIDILDNVTRLMFRYF